MTNYDTADRLTFRLAVALAIIGLVFFAALCSGAPTYTPTVAATRISPDGQWRVEVADYRARQVFELWATPSVGGVRRQIGRTVPALQDVRTDLLISADSRTVAYVQGETASGSNYRLWSTPIDRLAGVVISQPSPQSAAGFWLPLLSVCSGREVKFRSDPIIDELFDDYVVRFAGGEIRAWDECSIFRDGFESGNAGAWR